jgi:K+-transporting ATPase c subunit
MKILFWLFCACCLCLYVASFQLIAEKSTGGVFLWAAIGSMIAGTLVVRGCEILIERFTRPKYSHIKTGDPVWRR